MYAWEWCAKKKHIHRPIINFILFPTHIILRLGSYKKWSFYSLSFARLNFRCGFLAIHTHTHTRHTTQNRTHPKYCPYYSANLFILVYDFTSCFCVSDIPKLLGACDRFICGKGLQFNGDSCDRSIKNRFEFKLKVNLHVWIENRET